MDIRHIRYFLAVADARSFVAAARALNISQPPLSRRISDLEQEFGFKLFTRSRSGAVLTEAGANLYPYASDLVRAYQAVEKKALSLADQRDRRIRVALPPETSRVLLAELRARFENENIDYELEEASTDEQLRKISSRDIDVGVPRYPFDEAGLHLSPSLGQPLGLLMSMDHPLASKQMLQIEDLENYPLVIFPRDLARGFHDELLQICRDAGYSPPRVISSVYMMKAFLKSETAVTFIQEVKGRRLQKARPGDEFVWRPLHGDPVCWWTSLACRKGEDNRTIKKVFGLIEELLCATEGWKPMPRPPDLMHGDGR